MTRKNVYMNNRTRVLVENVMANHGIETHTEAVRFIVDRHEERDLAKEVADIRKEVQEMKRDLSHAVNLMIFMAESMSATSNYNKYKSPLYTDAVQLTDLEEMSKRREEEEMRERRFNDF